MKAVFGVQAQDRTAALLAIRVRTENADVDAVSAALSNGALVRTWAMRGTLHVLAADDLPAALAIFAPLHLRLGRRRLTQLGLLPDVAERSTAELAALEAPMTRAEIAERLRTAGIPAEGQATIHAIRRAALAGVLVEVGEDRYGPLDLAPLPDRDEALRELGRRYLQAHAPATPDDFATWSGLPTADVRTAWPGGETSAGAEISGAISGPGEAGGVRLLPAFDEWLLGWASREFTLPRAHAKRVAPGGGIIRAVAIDDGRVFATWRRARSRVELEPFGRVSKATRAAVEAEVEAIGGFLGTCLALKP